MSYSPFGQNTSSIMVVAKRTKSASRLSKALQEDKLKRNYLGWVEGNLKKTAKWTHWLYKDTKKNQVRITKENNSKAKKAILKAQPVRNSKWKNRNVTLICFQLETGRSHQIRVQTTEEGFPLLGDIKYGNTETKSFGRPALHSYEISFPHPMTGEMMKFKDELPEDMKLGLRAKW